MEFLRSLLHGFPPPPFILALVSVAQVSRHLGLFELSPKLTFSRKLLELAAVDKLGADVSQEGIRMFLTCTEELGSSLEDFSYPGPP